MSSSQTLYSITLTNSYSNASPSDGFVDNLKITDYDLNLESATLSGLTLANCEAKVRANFRYREIINQVSMITNAYVTEQANYPGTNFQPYTVSTATATTEATSFQFWMIIEHGDPSLVTPDEYNAGQFLTGAACLKRCIARALLLDAFREADVFDPTDSNSLGVSPTGYGSTTSVTRYGNRIYKAADFEIGPYAANVTDADAVVAVSKVTF